MVYTPPRTDSDEEATLEILRTRLDRTVKMPSQSMLPSTRKSRDTVPRSPCTSLYGNWRPTTGTEPYRKSTRTTKLAAKAAAKAAAEEKKPKNKQRGRPPGEAKPAVTSDRLPEFVARAAHVLEMNGGRMDSNLFGQQWKIIHVNAPLYAYKSTKAVTIHQMLRENGDFFEVSETDRQKVKMFTLKPEQTTTYLEQCRKQGTLVGNLDSPAQMVSKTSGVPIVKGDELEESVELEESMELPPLRAELEDATPLEKAQPAEEPHYSSVPVHGRARMASFDRRVVLGKKAKVGKERRERVEEDLPAAPFRHPDDALTRPVISLYNSWAMDGRDVVMEVTHRTAFDEMWEKVGAELDAGFTVVDAGCGNGWAARLMAQHEQCEGVTAVDAAALMIEKAGQSHERELEALDPELEMAEVRYEVGDVETWFPEEPVDVTFFGETLYLLEDPSGSLQHVVNSWLKPGGRVMASLDCYKENKLSHTWEEDLGVEMHCYGEKDWKGIFKQAGLDNVELWRAKAAGPWQGTLIVTGTKAA